MALLKPYNNQFYEKQLIQSSNSANYVIPILNKWFEPKNVVDVGCGVGAWLEVWKQFGNVSEIKGIDARFVDKSLMRINCDTEFLEFDLNNSLPKIKHFDIAMCLEVAEHLQEMRANSLVKDLTNLSDIILFSAAIPGQDGTNHINEQYLSYWIKKFEQNNFQCYDVIRPLIWDVKSVAWWYRQNMVLFIKKDVKLKVDLITLQSFNGFDLVQKDLLLHKEKKHKTQFKFNITKCFRGFIKFFKQKL